MMKYNVTDFKKKILGFSIIDFPMVFEMATISKELIEKHIYQIIKKVEKFYYYFKSVSKNSIHLQLVLQLQQGSQMLLCGTQFITRLLPTEEL